MIRWISYVVETKSLKRQIELWVVHTSNVCIDIFIVSFSTKKTLNVYFDTD